MRSNLTRVIAGVAAIAVGSLTFLSTGAQAAAPGTPAAGTSTLTPVAGTNAGNFNLAPPSGAACASDSIVGGYRWQTFMVADSVDPATLTYGLTGPVQQGSAFTAPLYTNTGAAVITKTTAANVPGVGGLLGGAFGIPTFSFASTPLPVPNGLYNIGYACTVSGVSDRFWSTKIEVTNSTATTFSYSLFAVPGAPTLSTVTAGVSQTLSGTFTAPASTPVTDSYLVTATPTVGAPVTLTVPAPATGFTLPGLTNGVSYSVTVQTTNAAGTGPVSTPAISRSVFDVNVQPSVTVLNATAAINSVSLTWVAPTGVTPTGYSIAVSGATTVVGSPFSAAAGALSFTVPVGACGTSYLFTVSATYSGASVATPASVSVAPLCDGTVVQTISAVRPAGALVLTQRCGVFGALPDDPASPGFPLLTATTASGGIVGTSPTLLAGGSDGQFGNYPNPSPVAPATYCGVNLGSGQLVTSGPLSGQYYTASGFINQVTVSDTRDTDTGWTVNGTMSAFSAAGVSFSGNLLGWNPVVSSTSGVTSTLYDQTVTRGATVLPDTALGLATGKVLSSAAAGAGLGIASFDARLKLLIPVSARAGTYTGTLTFTVA